MPLESGVWVGGGGLVSVVTVMMMVEAVLEGLRGQWCGRKRKRRQKRVQKNVFSTVWEFICL